MANKNELTKVRTEWYNGNTFEEYYVNKSGKKEDIYKYYDSNGQIRNQCTYDEGRKIDEKIWHENGQLYIECNFDDEKKLQGKYQSWDEKGNILKDKTYPIRSQRKVLSLLDEHGRECALPEGKIEVWKLCAFREIFVYVKLEVPEHAKRVTPIDPDRKYKSRVSEAKVLEIVDRLGTKYDCCCSCVHGYNLLTYRVGQIVIPDKFDPRTKVECGAGINVHRYKDQCDQWINQAVI
jgi:hypothetical protein